MLVVLVTVSVAISSPGMAFKILRLVKPVVLSKERAKLAVSSFFWGPSLIATRDSHNGTLWLKHCVVQIFILLCMNVKSEPISYS